MMILYIGIMCYPLKNCGTQNHYQKQSPNLTYPLVIWH